MTLQQFFEWIQTNPSYVVYYFLVLFLSTLALNSLLPGEGHLSPWNRLYSYIIYAVSIPGIFAITLSVYFFLFEKRSIMETELLLQVLPIVMMILILYLINRSVDLDFIPGFEKLNSLMWIIGVVLSLMWIIDRTHIYAITFIPFYYVIMLLIGGILLMRIAFKKIIHPGTS
jgi:hypothetical protein